MEKFRHNKSLNKQ